MQFGYAKVAFEVDNEISCYTIFKNELVEILGEFDPEVSEANLIQISGEKFNKSYMFLLNKETVRFIQQV